VSSQSFVKSGVVNYTGEPLKKLNIWLTKEEGTGVKVGIGE
jgi:hypothetical protein